MANSNATQQTALKCRSGVQEYSCGCKSSLVSVIRSRDCPTCQRITQESGQRAFCVPHLIYMHVPGKCGRCGHHHPRRPELEPCSTRNDPRFEDPWGRRTNTNTTYACLQYEDPSGRRTTVNTTDTTQQPQIPCTSTYRRFACRCMTSATIHRQLNCPNCREIRQAAGQQNAMCHPWPVGTLIGRLCNKCLFRFDGGGPEPVSIRNSQPPFSRDNDLSTAGRGSLRRRVNGGGGGPSRNAEEN
jgi:hypothetical protein